MRTISQVVEEIIARSPFLAEAIAEGIANNAQVARRIRPDVERRLLEEVSEASVSMALHRLSKRVVQRAPFGTRFLKYMRDITVRSNLIEYVFSDQDITELAEIALSAARGRKDAFVNFSRGIHESLLIVDKDIEGKITPAIRKLKVSRRVDDLSAITMRLPQESLNVPGVYYPILKALALEGISFVEVMSINAEFSVLFENKDIERAFATIKKLTS